MTSSIKNLARKRRRNPEISRIEFLGSTGGGISARNLPLLHKQGDARKLIEMEKPVPCTKAMVQLESVWGCNKERERKKRILPGSRVPLPNLLWRPSSIAFAWFGITASRYDGHRKYGSVRERERGRTGYGDREGPFSLAFDRSAGFHIQLSVLVCARLFCFVAKIDRLWKLLRGCTPFFSRESSLLASSVRNIHTDVGGLSRPPW